MAAYLISFWVNIEATPGVATEEENAQNGYGNIRDEVLSNLAPNQQGFNTAWADGCIAKFTNSINLKQDYPSP